MNKLKLKVFYFQKEHQCIVSYLKGFVINEAIKRNLSISLMREFHEREWFKIKRNINKNKKEFKNLI